MRSWRYRLLLLLVVGVGAAVFLALTFSRAQPGRRHGPQDRAPLVDVVEARLASVPMVVQAMGGVQPAQSVKLVPQVSGKVVFVSPELRPGGRVRKDQILVQIDPRDYDLAIREARAAVSQARLAVEVQKGQSAAARRELQLAGRELAPTGEALRLASRESYVENAQAQLDAAMSRMEQAELARSRADLRAPFDARVQDKQVDVGQVVSPQSTVATVVASREAWVEAALPTEQLRWIDVPGHNGQEGAPVRVRQRLAGNAEIVRQGRVLGLLPTLQERGKLARLLIGISDPFAEQAENGAASQPAAAASQPAAAPELPLLVGSFVHLEIQGRTLPDLLALPRGALREGGTVWVLDDQSLLAFREVEPVWRDGDTVYVRGALRPGERVITSHLASPLPKMRLGLAREAEPRVAAP